jgi:hypothetical protein
MTGRPSSQSLLERAEVHGIVAESHADEYDET